MMARSIPVKQQPQILQAKIRNISQLKGITLDLGIGRGGWTRFLLRRTHRLIGLDISIENLQEVKRTFQKLDLICGDALNLPFRSNVFDSIFAGYLLHHLPNLEIGLREAHRVLKPGGKFNSIDPNKSHPLFWLGWKARNLNLHPPRFVFGDFSHSTERPLNRKELYGAFSSAGFVNLKTKFFSSLPSALTERCPFLRPIDSLLGKIPFLCGNIFLIANKAKQGSEEVSKRLPTRISVIIPTRNRRKHLEECLRSLFKTNPRPDEVVVIDVCSTDGTKEVAESYEVKIFHVEELNRQRQRNIGVLSATGDIVVFLDDDVVIDKLALKYIKLAYNSQLVGGVGGRVLPYGAPKDHWVPACGCKIGKVRKDGVVIGNFDIPLQAPIEVDCLQGCFMSFRRETLLKSGGFDESYDCFFRGDDTDVCLAVKKLGYKIVYEPRAIVWHKALGKETMKKKEWVYGYVRGCTYFYFKNIFPEVKRYLPWFFLSLFFPPRDYVKKSGVKIRLSPSLPLTALRGIVDGILLMRTRCRTRSNSLRKNLRYMSLQ